MRALDDVSLEVQAGTLTALVGPDGAGKTTLIRLAAGLMTADAGELRVLGIDVSAEPQHVQDRIGYMPQKFGLYEDLSVQENLDLYADLHGISAEDRAQAYPRLMEMTALGPFTQRLAGRLSGGMKQKLGLACTLVSRPELLLLDEPTVGVDPLSRRELWEIILQLVDEQKLTVLLSTSYLDEAERCGQVSVMHRGKVLAAGKRRAISAGWRPVVCFSPTHPPAERPGNFKRDCWIARISSMPCRRAAKCVLFDPKTVVGRKATRYSLDASITAAAPRFEDGFMVLLHRTGTPRESVGAMTLTTALQPERDGTAVQVRDLVRQFGAFTAVDHISFDVQRGEIFGLLGPNGAGKTTTFRMLCGLLPATSGTLRVAGVDLRRARASARQRIGYVAQKFSLYGQLTVAENLEFFASAYSLRGDKKQSRIDWAIRQFDLGEFIDLAERRFARRFQAAPGDGCRAVA